MPTAEGAGLNRQSIAWRLALALGMVLLAIGLVSVACLWAIFDIHDRLHALKKDEERARRIVHLASAIRDQYAHVAHTIIIGNDSHAKFFRDATSRLEALAASLRGQCRPEVESDVGHIVAVSKEMARLFEGEVLPLVRAGDHAALVVGHDQIMGLAFRAQGKAEAIANKAEAAMEDLNQHVRATEHGVITLAIIAHIVAVLTAIMVGVYLYRTIARPITALSGAASRMGAGDLDSEIAVERDDELGRLTRRFNEMMQSMKEHQRKLLQSERLMGLATMSAGIAHELNNPLGVILGYAKLLQRRSEPVDPKILAAIEEEAERCRQVIEGLLELTRGGGLNIAAVDLRSLSEDVVGRLRVSQAARNVNVEIHGRGNIQGDQAKLRQVLTNLIANGLEACGAEGRVVVLIDERPDRAVTVEVHDTGPGVAALARDRIFEPFFTTKPTGSGLGLAISRAIARAHGGDVVVASTTERGAIFRLTLPAEPEAAS